MSFAEQNFASPSAQQGPSLGKAFLAQQAEFQPLSEYSNGLVTASQSPPSWLSPVSSAMANDEIQWDQILEEFHRAAESQDPTNRAGLVLGQRCACFTVALTAIQQISQCLQGSHIEDVGRILKDLSDAVKVCEQFSSCCKSCHHKYILLYIAILEQVDNHYFSLWRQIVPSNTDCQKVTMEIIIGNFGVKTSLGSDVGKALLTGEMKRASVCTRKLAKRFWVYVEEGCTAEVRCQQEILSALSDSIGRKIDSLKDRALPDML